MRQLDEERFIVKAANGPHYLMGCERQLDKALLKPDTCIVLDMTTLTVMRQLPRKDDPLVLNMLHEKPADVSFSFVGGGLNEQIREIREVLFSFLTGSSDLAMGFDINETRIYPLEFC